MHLIKQNALYISFFIALSALFVSLYAQYVLMIEPCVLCWWQRIGIYPLVPILAVGIIRRDPNVSWYGLPLVVVGFLAALYQTLLYFKVLTEAYAPCSVGVSCTQALPTYFGFVNLVTMSLGGFILIGILLVLTLKTNQSNA
jgi:disulfide bond formation protein DsbB